MRVSDADEEEDTENLVFCTADDAEFPGKKTSLTLRLSGVDPDLPVKKTKVSRSFAACVAT
jgi:hypothetical protein